MTTTGPVLFGSGNDYLQIYGFPSGIGNITLNGNVSLGGGNDTVLLYNYQLTPAVEINGDILLGDGGDQLGISDNFSIIGNIHGDDGNDSIEVGRIGVTSIAPHITGSIFGDGGSDTITIAHGSVVDGSVFGGDDIDFIDLNQGTVTGDVDWGAGDEAGYLDLSNMVLGGSLYFGEGSDTFWFANGVVHKNIFLGTGVNAGHGDDTFILLGGEVQGTVYGGLDNDAFIWSGGKLIGGFAGGDGSDIAEVSSSDFTGDEILDGGDDVSGTDGFVDVLTFTGQTFAAKGANLVNWEKIVVENALLSFSDGALTTGSEDGLGLIIGANGTVNAGTSFALTGNLDIQADSLFEGQGNGAGLFSVSSNVINAGTLSLGDGMAGDTFQIAGNYTGLDGAMILDTYLGADGSSTDKIVVTGGTRGAGSLKINNTGGPGALTVADGIQVIQVDGASDATFTLLGDYVHEGAQAVVGGAYAYKLYHNGISDPADGDWYLRSVLKDPTEPPVEPPVCTPGVDCPVEPPVDPVTPPEPPLYQAGAPVYEAYPQLLLGLNGLPTLQQRVGNRYWNNGGNRIIAEGADAIGSPYAPSQEAGAFIEQNGVWGRIEGAHNRIDPRFSTTNAEYDFNTYKIQAGLDGMLAESEAGKLIGGVSVHYARGSADIRSVYDADNGGGEIRTDGYGIGGTLTWYGESGFYVDAQVQATWYDSDLGFDGGNATLTNSNHGFGYALSVEGGKRIALDPAWSLTPQAQLVWSSVDFDDFSDVFGADVRLDRGRSLQGRLGLALDHQNSWYNANGLIDRTRLYAITNLYYEFLEGTKVSVAGTSFANDSERLWGGIGLGGSYNWNSDKYAIYGEGSINTSLAQFADSYSLKGTMGFRVKW
ncbi:autotransporter family protein [Brucella anthropi]|uniref:autotransporter family protein n=1 Tax=Brucella anthropi TaxID=529 RepID=UPI001F2693C5|nr:autotransporter outer membrane beta-barrel domain-containing protein [Brucella anthropi]